MPRGENRFPPNTRILSATSSSVGKKSSSGAEFEERDDVVLAQPQVRRWADQNPIGADALRMLGKLGYLMGLQCCASDDDGDTFTDGPHCRFGYGAAFRDRLGEPLAA